MKKKEKYSDRISKRIGRGGYESVTVNELCEDPDFVEVLNKLVEISGDKQVRIVMGKP